MRANRLVHIFDPMHDELRPSTDAVEDLDGVTPLFQRVFVAGDGEVRRDATALAATLAGRAETVTVAGRADLIVTGSAPDGAAGRVRLGPSERRLLEGAACPVAVAPRGLAGRDDHAARVVDVGFDGGRQAVAALDLAARLALHHGARLRLIAVAEIALEAVPTGRQADPREVERLATRLRRITDGLSGARVEIELREGQADEIMLSLAQESDVLVLGSRTAYGEVGRVTIGDLAARILCTAPCPTVVVPAA